MANFGELSGIKQWGVVIVGGALVTSALYFTVFKSQNDKNVAAQHALEAKIRENNELESYRPKLKQIEQQLAELKQQLEIEQRIVPDAKQVDGFITMLDGAYYSMLNFFDRVGKLERIVNISGLMLATTKNPQNAKAKHTYQYAPNESTVATCTATTFFSHDLQPGPAAPGAKPGTPAAR